MENYYKITKEQAYLMGKLSYEKNKEFNPYVGEQKDGSFLVSERMYILLKERSEFKKIDFTKQIVLSKAAIDLKPFVK